jgi:hypothetical protein
MLCKFRLTLHQWRIQDFSMAEGRFFTFLWGKFVSLEAGFCCKKIARAIVLRARGLWLL